MPSRDGIWRDSVLGRCGTMTRSGLPSYLILRFRCRLILPLWVVGCEVMGWDQGDNSSPLRCGGNVD